MEPAPVKLTDAKDLDKPVGIVLDIMDAGAMNVGVNGTPPFLSKLSIINDISGVSAVGVNDLSDAVLPAIIFGFMLSLNTNVKSGGVCPPICDG